MSRATCQSRAAEGFGCFQADEAGEFTRLGNLLDAADALAELIRDAHEARRAYRNAPLDFEPRIAAQIEHLLAVFNEAPLPRRPS